MSEEPFASLKSAIDRLETSWAEGTLPVVLADEGEILGQVLGSEVLADYAQLATETGARATAFRRRGVYGLVDRLRRSLRRPRRWFAALPEPEPTAVRGLRVTVGERVLGLRLDQVLAARTWEIGFQLPEPAVASLEQTVHSWALRRLAADLRDLRKVEKGANPHWIDDHPDIVANETACRFEQLMIDILNEHRHVAHHAPLLEDLCQKTDLRVNFPALDRRRGARVQVTAVLNPHELAAKVQKIPHSEEMVILSPLHLAEAVGRPDLEPWLPTTDTARFWDCFPSRPVTPGALARGLNGIFFQALAAADGDLPDPRGPMGLVPEAVRHFVQASVTAEALRSTQELRRNQVKGRSVLRRRMGLRRRRGAS